MSRYHPGSRSTSRASSRSGAEGHTVIPLEGFHEESDVDFEARAEEDAIAEEHSTVSSFKSIKSSMRRLSVAVRHSLVCFFCFLCVLRDGHSAYRDRGKTRNQSLLQAISWTTFSSSRRWNAWMPAATRRSGAWRRTSRFSMLRFCTAETRLERQSTRCSPFCPRICLSSFNVWRMRISCFC
jgi:hypothetical protein